jgi:hypothetical protein
VFPVRYGLDLYILCRGNSVFKAVKVPLNIESNFDVIFFEYDIIQ